MSPLFQIGQALNWGWILRRPVRCLSAQRSNFTTAVSTNCEYRSLSPFIFFFWQEQCPDLLPETTESVLWDFNHYLSLTLACPSPLKISPVKINVIWSLAVPRGPHRKNLCCVVNEAFFSNMLNYKTLCFLPNRPSVGISCPFSCHVCPWLSDVELNPWIGDLSVCGAFAIACFIPVWQILFVWDSKASLTWEYHWIESSWERVSQGFRNPTMSNYPLTLPLTLKQNVLAIVSFAR